MALHAPVVTKVSVSEPQEKRYSITVNLTIPDDEIGWDGINRNFSFDYNAGANIADKEDALLAQMQEAIDRYKHAKAVFKSSQLDNALASVQSALLI